MHKQQTTHDNHIPFPTTHKRSNKQQALMERQNMSPSPMKRRRQEMAASPPIHFDALQMVSDLNQAVKTESRLRVLSALFQHLGYNMESRVCVKEDSLGALVEKGAVNALCLQLGFLLNKRDISREELEYTCRALELLYRCSDSIRETSLQEIGSDLIYLLLRAFKRGEYSARREIVAIFYSTACCNTGVFLLIKSQGLMAAVSDILRDEMICNEVVIDSLGLLKRLTHCAEESRVQILEQPGLLSCLVRLPFTTALEKATERLSCLFRNLAATPSVRIAMLQDNEILTALVRLANCNRRTTRNMLSTLDCLTMETDYCVAIVMHGDGALLNVLRRLVGEESDHVMRRRAARALRLLACDKAIPLLIQDSNLMDTLYSSALNDSTREVRIEAAKAFANCAALIRAPMPQHDAILKSLTTLATGSTVMPEVIARALKEQALHPLNRVPMADHRGLLEALAAIATQANGSITAKEYAMGALLDLSCEEVNREKMVTSAVLRALVENALDRSHDTHTIRAQAMNSLLNLSSVESNLKRMANHEGLLRALVQYASTAPEERSKRAVKKVIMALVPLL
jgi:hypothetical protein